MCFPIFGINNDELDDDQKVWKARCVFQGSNVRTKPGTCAADLFEETSNGPAFLAAARAALGVAAMRGFNAPFGDAEAHTCRLSSIELRAPHLWLSCPEGAGRTAGL